MTSGLGVQGQRALSRVLDDAAMLRLRLLGLTLSGVLMIFGGIVVAIGAFGLAPLGQVAIRLGGIAVGMPMLVFAIGLAAVIGAGVTLLRVSAANERAGAVARLLDGRAGLRSTRARSTGSRVLLDLVFDDGHRAVLELSHEEADALRPLLAARRARVPYRS